MSGGTLKNQLGDTKDQLYQIMIKQNVFDYIVNSPTAWANIIERTAANTYQFKSGYYSIYFKNAIGGYSINSILSGGDTWGVIKTNGIVHLVFESGTYINVGDSISYLEVNTDDCYLQNVWINGIGTVAVAIVQSFLLNAYRVVFENCKTSNRYSSIDFAGFQGSATALHNITSKHIGCGVYNMNFALAGGHYGYAFNDCYNVENSYIYNVVINGGSFMCFRDCVNINGSNISDLESINSNSNLYIASDCNNISDIKATDITCTTGNGQPNLFFNCYNVENCYISAVDSVDAYIYGTQNCRSVNNLYYTDFDTSGLGGIYGTYSTYNVSNCYFNDFETLGANALIMGARSCYNVSNCYFTNFIIANANNSILYDCFNVYGCTINTINVISGQFSGIISPINAIGNRILNITSSSAMQGIVGGFNVSQNYINTLTSSASIATGIDSVLSSVVGNTVLAVVGNTAIAGTAGINNCIYGVVGNRVKDTNNVGAGTAYGIYACKKCQQNSGTGNKTAMYNTSYADSAVANACADTAAGGYNSAT